MEDSDQLVLGDVSMGSRLIVGTGKFSDAGTMLAAIRASGCDAKSSTIPTPP